MCSYRYNDYRPSEEVNELKLTLITDLDLAAQGSTYSLSHICQLLLQQQSICCLDLSSISYIFWSTIKLQTCGLIKLPRKKHSGILDFGSR